MPTFADRLATAIANRKTSQAEVARKAGVSAASISDWARAVTGPANIKAEPLLRAAAFLNVNPMWLLTGKGTSALASATVLVVEEPRGGYAHAWPFTQIDVTRVSGLQRDDLMRLEGAWLHAAAQLGFALSKPAVA